MSLAAAYPPKLGRHLGLAIRLAAIPGLLLLEKVLLSLFVDSPSAAGIGATVWLFQHWALRFLVTLAIALGLFSYASGRERFIQVAAAMRVAPVRTRWLVLHAVLLAPLAVVSTLLYGPHAAHPFTLVAGAWMVLALASLLALLTAIAPWDTWWQAARAPGILWLYATVAAVVSACAIQWSASLWSVMARATFRAVTFLLQPFIPALQANPATLVMDTGRFAVLVTAACSGVEGIGLMLAFCTAWLVLFRAEFRLPRALLLIPAGVVLILALNVLRIAALVLIGHAGWPQTAAFGFHSQAGWLAFNIAACLVAFASRRSSWLSSSAGSEATENPTAAYLLPFLGILAGGMLARALASSNDFEACYVLRPAAALIALFFSWPTLRGLDWRVSWRGPAVGVLAFGCWALGARLLTTPAPIPTQLAALSPTLSDLWIAIRIVGSVALVPLAEELAYRGFLLRRLMAADFPSVRFQSVRPWALLLTAAVFGAGHGSMWLPGMVAGLLYGAMLIRSGSMGETVVAHATTNGLVAGWVLLGGQWQLWS